MFFLSVWLSTSFFVARRTEARLAAAKLERRRIETCTYTCCRKEQRHHHRRGVQQLLRAKAARARRRHALDGGTLEGSSLVGGVLDGGVRSALDGAVRSTAVLQRSTVVRSTAVRSTAARSTAACASLVRSAAAHSRSTARERPARVRSSGRRRRARRGTRTTMAVDCVLCASPATFQMPLSSKRSVYYRLRWCRTRGTHLQRDPIIKQSIGQFVTNRRDTRSDGTEATNSPSSNLQNGCHTLLRRVTLTSRRTFLTLSNLSSTDAKASSTGADSVWPCCVTARPWSTQ